MERLLSLIGFSFALFGVVFHTILYYFFQEVVNDFLFRDICFTFIGFVFSTIALCLWGKHKYIAMVGSAISFWWLANIICVISWNLIDLVFRIYT